MKFFQNIQLLTLIKFSFGGYLFPDGPTFVNDHVYIAFTPNLYEAHFHKIIHFENLWTNDNFDNEKPTVIYIPGFGNNGVKDKSVTAIRSAYRERGDHNVILVDWTYYAKNTLYLSLIPQLKIICETIAVNLMKFLKKGYSVNKIHLVGHSLGAQCIGLVGRHLRFISKGEYEIPRLYGLDPAGPGFEIADWMTLFGGTFDSISSFDGKHVQIIHSNAGTLGIGESRGHVDFFPNGGKAHSGCEDDIVPSSCYHSRAWQFYQESVRNETSFIALKCGSFEDFKNNVNNSKCDTHERAYMGYGASSETRGNYYLRTHRNVYRLSLGYESLKFRKTMICYGTKLPCKYEDEFIDRT